jgi:hypothetical protein
MQIDYVKISCKEDVHICCTNFAKRMEENLHETNSWWKTYGKHMENNCFLRTFKFEMLDTFFDCPMLQWEEDQNRKYKVVKISTIEIAV